MDVGDWVELVAVMFLPTLLVLAAIDLPMRSQRLRATEGALTDCAVDAAVALGVLPSDRPAPRALARPELRRLLDRLVDEGLALPRVGLLAGPSSSADAQGRRSGG